MFKKFFDQRALSNLRSAQAAVDANKGGTLEQGRAAIGHVLGQAAGGAVLGGVGNAAVYGSQGEGIGGAYTMPEAFIGGAMAGALAGAGIGAFGAKGAANRAVASSAKAQKRLEKAKEVFAQRNLFPTNKRPGATKSNINWQERIPQTSSKISTRGSLTPTQSRALTNQGNARIRRQGSGYQNALMTHAENPINTPAAKYHMIQKHNPNARNRLSRQSYPGGGQMLDLRTGIPWVPQPKFTTSAGATDWTAQQNSADMINFVSPGKPRIRAAAILGKKIRNSGAGIQKELDFGSNAGYGTHNAAPTQLRLMEKQRLRFANNIPSEQMSLDLVPDSKIAPVQGRLF